MTSVVKITRLFAEARNNQKKFAGTHNNDHLIPFKEDLRNVCLQIASEGTGVGNPSGDPSVAILEDARYQVAVATSMPYDCQVAACTNYDPDLQSNDTASCSKEENWEAITRNQSRKRAIKGEVPTTNSSIS